MMKQSEIVGLMEGTIPYTDKTLSHLADAIKEYPYFQAAHVLHTLNLLHLKDSYFLFDLRKTSIYTPDRKKIFFQVKDAFFVPIFAETIENREVLEKAEKIEKAGEIEVIEEVETIEEIEKVGEVEEVEEIEEVGKIEEYEELEEVTNLEETETEKEEVASETINPSEKIEIPEKEEITDDSSSDLMNDFLSKSEEIAPKETKKKESPFVSFDYISYLLSEKTENPETPPLQQQETIDKFLEAEAGSPVRIKIDSSNEPKRSNVPNVPEEIPVLLPDKANGDTFFSETLAKIYLKQKKYDKALEIIRNLYLIYPEKNRYFADQIRFLEKLVINTNKN